MSKNDTKPKPPAPPQATVEPSAVEPPKIIPTSPRPDLNELRKECHRLIENLKIKYAENYQPPALARAGKYAYDTWEKAAIANPYTGEAQLDVSSGQSSVERYFLGRLAK